MTTTKWALDPTHSEIGFKVKHMMFTNVSGNFTSFNVTAETSGDDFAGAKIEFTADTASVNTNNEQRDGHLKSGDFFDAETFPKISFSATSYKQVSGSDYELVGNLTIKDVTKSVTLNVENGGLMKDPWGNLKAGFTITGKINRNDFGLVWNAALETGGVLVSEEVKINCEIQLVKQA
jgi:polyisoprenoid-binding protein YceI